MTTPQDYSGPYWAPNSQPSPAYVPPAPSVMPPAQPYPVAVPYYAPVAVPYQPAWVAVPAQPPANGMGIAGMVLGIISLIGGGITVLMPIVGLILSIVGRNQAAQEGSSTGHAVAGIVCNAIALVGWGLLIVFYLILVVAVFSY